MGDKNFVVKANNNSYACYNSHTGISFTKEKNSGSISIFPTKENAEHFIETNELTNCNIIPVIVNERFTEI